MYGITESKPMVGIGVHPAKLKDIEFVSLKEGNAPVIRFVWNVEGMEIRDVLWPIDVEKTKQLNSQYPKQHNYDNKNLGFVKGTQVTDEHAVTIAINDFNNKIKHIAHAFLDSTWIFNADSYAQVASILKDSLKDYFAGGAKEKEVPLFVEKDKDFKYLRVPAKAPFIGYTTEHMKKVKAKCEKALAAEEAYLRNNQPDTEPDSPASDDSPF